MMKPATSSLSARQREVLDSLAEGQTYQEIGTKMGISIHTVRNHVRRIYQKLEVRNSAQATACIRVLEPDASMPALSS
jgi:RNA polymerase sigma factor (sigma-70 family)